MGTNGTDVVAQPRLEEEIIRQSPGRSGADALETAGDFALAPLVDKIAYGIARGLVVAMKELEQHIASETRKVGDTVDRRLDAFQASLHDLSKFVSEQRSTNSAVEEQLHQLTVAAGGLRETDARQASDLEALRRETKAFSSSVSQRIEVSVAALQERDARQAADLAALQNETKVLSQSVSDRIEALCNELGVQQEDIAAVKATLCNFSSRVDALVERLDRQADAVRSMCAAYSQRETELEHLVEGLARLRAYPTPMPGNGL
jgi:chromosome segregation ATPase